jgi:bacteriocin biosynthesis cyclodehydratase domain-containing protein
MRPALKAGLLPVWRDRDTLQIGIDPRRAVALSGMRDHALLIGLLDGSRNRDEVLATAARHGIPVTTTERILTLLAAGGIIDDFPAGTMQALAPSLRARLAPELATASLAHADASGGAGFLARRRAAAVTIDGERRIGRAIARILSAAGVGTVTIGTGPATARSGSGLARPPTRAKSVVAGYASASRLRMAVLVGRPGLEVPVALVRQRVPHLAITATEAIGIVGPLVIPGKTACLRCLDYVRAAHDRSWPLILAQLGSRRPEPVACDAVLVAAVAAQAAAQVLAAIDKEPMASAAANGTLELVLPDWRWRRRTWPAHPACPCAAARPALPCTAHTGR